MSVDNLSTPTRPAPVRRPPVIASGLTVASMTEKISSIVLSRDLARGWLMLIALSGTGVMVLGISVGWLLFKGVGVWGINEPVAWGFDIINFVWWIGIGHAGTLISAILLLLHQEWRTSINRFSEAMTLFAVMCAGMFPLLHLGRPWLAFWLFPLPNTMSMWPQFRSPLMWDVFAVSTYGTVSLLFWYVGLIPDFATLRDRAQNKAGKLIFGMVAMGWRGAAQHWARYEVAYLLLAGLATPLVVSVHTVVSFDFSVGVIPGWHTTVMPPYFVAGAVYSGFAMVLTLMLPVRAAYKLHDLVTERHIENMGKVMLATGLIVAYGYTMELFFGFYAGNTAEGFLMANRMWGSASGAYAGLLLCNIITPQFLWIRKVRTSVLALFVISIIVNIGMWLERYVIVVTCLERDFLPSAWGDFHPTIWDISLFIGTISFFVFMMLLFIRFIPMIPIFEMRTLIPKSQYAARATRETVHDTTAH
ncbi:MAG TPA: NrfD/PsrC family molybdoenzyme membrane anchor subunit [Planctomycetota bacterium]|nr:NrfD/PsrC family molybdoenzyme membrane anchor subunit [Planctomycetota bacterium]